MTTSAFDRWFEAKYGKRPYPYGANEGKLHNKIEDGKRAETLLRQCGLYDSCRDAALSAWMALKK